MGTTKRERQKANREARMAELKKQQARDDLMKRLIRWTKFGALLVAAILASNLLIGTCSDEPATPTTTTLVESP